MVLRHFDTVELAGELTQGIPDFSIKENQVFLDNVNLFFELESKTFRNCLAIYVSTPKFRGLRLMKRLEDGTYKNVNLELALSLKNLNQMAVKGIPWVAKLQNEKW